MFVYIKKKKKSVKNSLIVRMNCGVDFFFVEVKWTMKHCDGFRLIDVNVVVKSAVVWTFLTFCSHFTLHSTNTTTTQHICYTTKLIFCYLFLVTTTKTKRKPIRHIIIPGTCDVFPWDNMGCTNDFPKDKVVLHIYIYIYGNEK